VPSPGYLAIYDIAEDRERDQVATVLEGYGQRIQYSAFELQLSARDRNALLRRLEELKLSSGWVAIYRRAAGVDRAAIGVVPDVAHDPDEHSVIVMVPPTSSQYEP